VGPAFIEESRAHPHARRAFALRHRLGELRNWTLERFLGCAAFAWTAEVADDWRVPPADHVATRYEQKRPGRPRAVWAGVPNAHRVLAGVQSRPAIDDRRPPGRTFADAETSSPALYPSPCSSARTCSYVRLVGSPEIQGSTALGGDPGELGIAFFEYCLAVPANRWAARLFGGRTEGYQES